MIYNKNGMLPFIVRVGKGLRIYVQAMSAWWATQQANMQLVLGIIYLLAIVQTHNCS